MKDKKVCVMYFIVLYNYYTILGVATTTWYLHEKLPNNNNKWSEVKLKYKPETAKSRVSQEWSQRRGD